MRFWCTTNRQKCKTKASNRQKQKKLLLLNSVIDFTENSRSTAISRALPLTSFLSTIYLFIFFNTENKRFVNQKHTHTHSCILSWWNCMCSIFYCTCTVRMFICLYVCVCGQKQRRLVCAWHTDENVTDSLLFFFTPRSFHSLSSNRSSLISSIFFPFSFLKHFISLVCSTKAH